jgi:anti-sigma regulatory factor (Ser/Thr protein kinase)
MAEQLLHLRVPATEDAPHMARDAVAALDGALGDDREDTLLLVSELVTNSVLHAGIGEEDPVSVTVHVHEDCLRVEVGDPGAGFVPDPRTGEGIPEGYRGGWGLRLVQMLARRWGVEPQGAGALVWFEMDRRRPAYGRLAHGR